MNTETALPEIPGYHLVREVGRGGMAVVYLATQNLFERKVALKLMQPGLGMDPDFGQRFFREARIIGQLNHPHIVPVYEVGEQDGRYFLSMEFLPAGDLGSRIDDGMSVSDVVEVTLQVAEALAFAHSHGVIHRDVKPDNILFRSSDDAVLMDFGIARNVDDRGDITVVEAVVGSPRYMSPEQSRGEELDHRSDIFSLGVVLFEMLTGRVPFEGNTAASVALKQLEDSPLRLSGQEKIFQPVLAKMIALNPRKRFKDANALVVALEEVRDRLSGGGFSAQDSALPEERPTVSGITALRRQALNPNLPGRAERRRTALLWSAGVGSLLLGAALLGYLLSADSGKPVAKIPTQVQQPLENEPLPVPSASSGDGNLPGQAVLIDLGSGEAVSRGNYRSRPRAGVSLLSPGYYLYDLGGRPIETFNLGAMQALALPTPEQVYRYSDIVSGRVNAATARSGDGWRTGIFDEVIAVREGDRRLLAELRSRAAAGEEAAQLVLSELTDAGWGVPRDSRRALELAGQAARHGYPLAHYQAAVIQLQSSLGEKRDALSHLRQAVDAGFFLAMTTLADIYWQGSDPDRKREALSLYRSAASSGDREAMFRLGSIILETEPRHGSRFEALSYLHRAVASGQEEAAELLARTDAKGTFDGSRPTDYN